MEYFYEGDKFKLVHCTGALESYHDALESVQADKQGAMQRGIQLQIEKLCNGHKLSAVHTASEGTLPNSNKFFALKRLPIRAYYWHSKSRRAVIYVSHYVSKDYRRLRPADTERVGNNWKRVEEQGDEC